MVGKTLWTMFLTVFVFFFKGSTIINLDEESALLWKISGKGSIGPSYLFGTIHRVCKQDIHIGDSLLTKFLEAKILCLESQMIDDPVANIYSDDTLSDNLTLTSLIGKQNFVLVKDLLYQTFPEITAAHLDRIKPMYVENFLISALFGCPISSYEDSLRNLANSLKKQIMVFETVPPTGFYTPQNAPLELQTNRLQYFLNNVQKIKARKLYFLQLYQSKNIEKIRAMTILVGNEKMQYDILDRRNRDWIKTMNEVMKKNQFFFAVGAAHLAGKNGVINLLRKEGYTVEAIQSNN